MINEKMDAILKTQDINTLKAMIDDGFELDGVDLFDVLAHFINSDEKADSRFIKFLIDNGIKLEHISKKHNSDLMLLVYLGLDEIVDDFISKGCDINATNAFGMNTFHWAVAGGQYTTAKLLMEKGADIYAKVEFEVEYYDKTVSKADRLQKFIARCNVEEVINEDYGDLDNDVKPQRKTVELTSFALAFNTYNPKIVRLLLEKGFNPNEDVMRQNRLFDFFDDKPTSDYHINESAISVVCENNNTELLKLMIENGANGFETYDLAKACENLNFEMIKLLVKAGVNKNKSNPSPRWASSYNPLSIVCSNSTIEPIEGNCASNLNIHGSEVLNIIKYLIENGADVNIDSPLMAACSLEYGNKKTDIYYNEAFADVNLEIIDTLIKHGADVNYVNFKGVSILMEAINRHNSFELSKKLIEAGADVNHKDNIFGNSVLMNIGVDPQYCDYWNDNWDELASKTEHKYYDNSLFEPQKILKLLIDNKADISYKNKLGFTPLMKYSLDNNQMFVKILLEHGADINARSEMTAFDLTQNEEIKALIQKAKNNNPQKLIKLLKNFTIDKPIKYTTHDWELFHPNNCEYKNFDGYMDAVKKQFDSMKSELEELSPNLYKKIYTFLIEDNPEPTYSWCHKTHINMGWSSLKGLKEHCDAGKKAENFVLSEAIVCEIDFRKTRLTTFKDIVNLFKQEIEIRENFRNLETLFATQQEELGDKFNFDLSGAKLTRQFYTDVEKFSGMLSKIFNEIKTRKEFPNISVTTQEMEEDRSIVLKITQIDSFSHCDAQGLLDEAKDGDFAEIKENLKNLCDWSVESSFGENAFRINYLYSNNVKEIEPLSEKPKGFTHVLRFYK